MDIEKSAVVAAAANAPGYGGILVHFYCPLCVRASERLKRRKAKVSL
jgi:hypothetical protein